MELENPEIYALQIDGFLNSLRCLIGHPVKTFGAGYIEKNGRDIESIVDESIKRIRTDGKLTSKSTVTFKELQHIFDQNIYSKLLSSNEENIKNLDWNFVEYYGLASTAEDEDGEWNRLVGQEHIILKYVDENGSDSIIFFVEYLEFVIATYL